MASIDEEQAGTLNWEKVDIGCGPQKTPGYTGVDIYPYEGVDMVQNFDEPPWNIPDQSCSDIRCIHVIEHVRDLKVFLRSFIALVNLVVRFGSKHRTSVQLTPG